MCASKVPQPLPVETGDGPFFPRDSESGKRSRGNGSDPEQTTRSKSGKRSRLTLACEECRIRKIRCDSERPVCSACATRHGALANCVYQSQRGGATFSREYVDQLQKKIHELQSRSSFTSTSPLEEHHNRNRARKPTPIAPTSTSAASTLFGGADDSSDNHEASQAEAGQGIDGMGNLGIAGGGRGSSEVYGRSSTASFMRQLRNAVKEKVQTPEQQVGQNQGDSQISREPHRKAQKPKYCPSSIVQHCVLPPRHLADTMLKYFWIQGHALYPFLCKATFLTAYESLWTGERVLSDQIMTYCILNVIFAIVSQFLNDDAAEMREATADAYFKRAMRLLQIEILGSGSLQLIQALLIMGMYLQSTDTPHRCWVMIGIAIRVAQGLGLHLRETTEIMQRQTDRELARRIWHGCVLMDRILSMTLGQPLMIGRAISESVPLPACIDEAYLSSDPGREGAQPSNVPSNMEFFRLTLKLYNILEDILSTFYPSGVSDQITYRKDYCISEETHYLDLNAILRIDKLLSEWMASIPPHLVSRPPAIDSDVDEGFLRQANVLKLRYLHLQILLFRPVLSQLLSAFTQLQRSDGSELEVPLQLAISLPFANKCVLAAQEIVEITHSHRRNDGSFEPLPAWWYKVFYVYSAATVLIAARICRPLHGTISDTSIKSSWLRCFEVLKGHTEVSKSARYCVAALEFLDKNIVIEQDQTTHSLRQQSTIAPLNNTQQVPLSTAFIPEQDVTNLYPPMVQPEFGDSFYNVNLAESQDVAWLHSVPIDLFQYDNSDMFGRTDGPFFNL